MSFSRLSDEEVISYARFHQAHGGLVKESAEDFGISRTAASRRLRAFRERGLSIPPDDHSGLPDPEADAFAVERSEWFVEKQRLQDQILELRKQLREGRRHAAVSVDGPSWPVVEPGPRLNVAPAPAIRPPSREWKTAVILPDIQMGGWHDEHGVLHTTHDERALSVVRQAVRDIQPDKVIGVGDNLDLPNFSLKFVRSPAFARDTQVAIDRFTLFGGELRHDAPGAEIVFIEGNHEKRLTLWALQCAAAAFGLKRGAALPEDWPVLSVPYLCRMEEHGIEYLEGYPANTYWLNERLRVVHGDKVKGRGSTAHLYLGDEDRVSTIFGHVHRIEKAMKTREAFSGPRTVLAECFGCLCRVDGAVPSVRSGLKSNGQPTGGTMNWQQGFGVVEYQPGDGLFTTESVPIFDGRAKYRGQEFVGEGKEAAA